MGLWRSGAGRGGACGLSCPRAGGNRGDLCGWAGGAAPGKGGDSAWLRRTPRERGSLSVPPDYSGGGGDATGHFPSTVPFGGQRC